MENPSAQTAPELETTERYHDFDDDLVDEVANRNDIFRYPLPENPFLRAGQALRDAFAKVDEYNDAVEELKALGYHQFPLADGIDGYNAGDRAGCCIIRFENILEMLSQLPEPLCFEERERNLEEEKRRRLEGKPKKPKRQHDYSKKLIQRLGETPEEWRCCYCLKLGDSEIGPDGRRWHVDHSYPESLGGDASPDNMVLSCASCNLSKHDKSAIQHVRMLSNGVTQ